MKYILELQFKNKPECRMCMLNRPTAKNLNGESIEQCQAIGYTPRTPEEGCRDDCPLKENEEIYKQESNDRIYYVSQFDNRVHNIHDGEFKLIDEKNAMIGKDCKDDGFRVD